MILKILCLLICAALLFVCYRANTFAGRVLKKSEDEITDRLVLKIKAVTLAVSIILFICTIIFIG